MKWKEKIRSMNDDELAEFINSCSDYGGFIDTAGVECEHRKGGGECSSEFCNRACKTAVKNLLESEVEE